MSNNTPLTFETVVNLSSEEFTRLVMQNTSISDKDILLMVTRFEADILEKIKHKDGEKSERYLFYKRVLQIMYIALQAEENINFWKNVAIRSKIETEFHLQNATTYYNDLLKYKAVEEVINTGKIDEYIQQVKTRNKTNP